MLEIASRVTICPAGCSANDAKIGNSLSRTVESPFCNTVKKMLQPKNKLLIVAFLLCFAGCEVQEEVAFRFNQVEWVRQERLNLEDNEKLDSGYKNEIGNILTAAFGTPDEPHLLQLYPTDEDPMQLVFGLEKLKLAAGPVKSGRHGEPAGLFREHCVQCHGISGDGKGPTAAFLNPYPRDFRLGKFKFKSTPIRRPPTDEDLTRVIRNGVAGTAMPAFKTLSPNEVESLIQYVKYLSMRGQMERRLIAEVDSMDGDPLLNLSLVADSESDSDEFNDQMIAIFEEFLIEDIADRWVDADENISSVEIPPASFATEHPEHAKLLLSGKQLFGGKANCVQCHGPTGLGDGQNQNYDDWTNDWLKTAGVDPTKPSTYDHFLRAGALKPRYISPRNLQLGVFRGGDRPEDIYRRIANGIEGTPMPSAPTLSSDEIWALVAYVRELRFGSVQYANSQVGKVVATSN